MANVKLLGTSKIATAGTVYCIVRREIDLYRLNAADGSFAAAPASPYLTLTEDAVIKGLYEVSESREAWTSGRYKVFVYAQAGGSPVPASDSLDDEMDFSVVGDRINVDFPYESGAVVADGANSATSFVTSLINSVDTYCKDSYLKFVSGTLINQQKRISAYNGSSKLLTLTSGFTTTPTAGDEFFIVNQ